MHQQVPSILLISEHAMRHVEGTSVMSLKGLWLRHFSLTVASPRRSVLIFAAFLSQNRLDLNAFIRL